MKNIFKKSLVSFLVMGLLASCAGKPSMVRDPEITGGTISVLVPEKNEMNLLPTREAWAAATFFGGWAVQLAVLNAAKKNLQKFSPDIPNLTKFDFENYITDKLVSEIPKQGIFQTKKDNDVIVKKILAKNLSTATNPKTFLKNAAGYKELKKIELPKAKNNLVLFYGLTNNISGNAKEATGIVDIVFVLVNKENGEPVWYTTVKNFTEKILMEKFTPNQFEEAYMEIIDKAIAKAVHDLHATESPKKGN